MNAAPTPYRPSWRDPWGWAAVLAIVPLVLHTLGAPLGEPVADDFDLLHYALFSPHHTWLDGGGSQTFWRPLAYQAYYGLLAPLMLSRPLVIVAFHVASLALATLLFYRIARRFMPGPWAAAAASFPLLLESTRALICVPVHFVDVGLIAFSALALHEAAFGRLPSALAALAAALLCKESAIATAVLMPFVAPAGGRRIRWAAAAGAVALSWGLVYLWVRGQHGLALPRGLESNLGSLGGHAWERFAWAAGGSLRAMFSLPAASSPWDVPVTVAMVALAMVAAWRFLASAAARARLASVGRLVALGVLWSAFATAPLMTVWPIWSPQRVAFASLGIGAALSATLGAAHPALLAAMVAVRLGLFALSPGPPATISALAPESGAFVDFPRLVRVQRMMRETREALMSRYPTLPRGARVGLIHPPLMTEYAFGGSEALQIWYRDSTLRLVRYEDFRPYPTPALDAVVMYQPERRPQMMLVEPVAMQHYLLAQREERPWPVALADLDRADALQADTTAFIFRGRVAGLRSLALLSLERIPEADREARRGLALWAAGRDARFTLAWSLALRRDYDRARAELDTLFSYYPNDTIAFALQDSMVVWQATGR